MLTLQNHVSLRTVGSLDVGSLKARAWETLRTAVQGVVHTRAAAAMRDGANSGGITATRSSTSNVAPRILQRGIERC